MRDAHPCIFDLDAKRDPAVALVQPARPHHHFTAFGKFHRIAHEIGEHLADATGIAAQRHCQRLVEITGELHALLVRPRREQREDLLHHGPQLKFHRLHPHLARLNLREIQDVVDDAQQAFRAARDHVPDVALLRIQPCVHEQARHANDPVHRRADFVTHVGQKL